MSEALVPVVEVDPRVQLGVIRADGPKELVRVATEAADALRDVISRKKLFSNIQGKEYVRVEGWTTLATMMGCLPREVSVSRDEKGTYTATVELVRMNDQAVLTRASAECGMDEKTWASRPDYARRSMAMTRATSKACRLAFSWVMVLAGYEATPSEEIPEAERGGATSRAGAQSAGRGPGVESAAPTVPLGTTLKDLSQKPPELNSPDPEPIWPYGGANVRGKLLSSFSTEWLVAQRKVLEAKNSRGDLTPLMDQIDGVLAARGGEV